MAPPENGVGLLLLFEHQDGTRSHPLGCWPYHADVNSSGQDDIDQLCGRLGLTALLWAQRLRQAVQALQCGKALDHVLVHSLNQIY